MRRKYLYSLCTFLLVTTNLDHVSSFSMGAPDSACQGWYNIYLVNWPYSCVLQPSHLATPTAPSPESPRRTWSSARTGWCRASCWSSSSRPRITPPLRDLLSRLGTWNWRTSRYVDSSSNHGSLFTLLCVQPPHKTISKHFDELNTQFSHHLLIDV